MWFGMPGLNLRREARSLPRLVHHVRAGVTKFELTITQGGSPPGQLRQNGAARSESAPSFKALATSA